MNENDNRNEIRSGGQPSDALPDAVLAELQGLVDAIHEDPSTTPDNELTYRQAAAEYRAAAERGAAIEPVAAAERGAAIEPVAAAEPDAAIEHKLSAPAQAVTRNELGADVAKPTDRKAVASAPADDDPVAAPKATAPAPRAVTATTGPTKVEWLRTNATYVLAGLLIALGTLLIIAVAIS